MIDRDAMVRQLRLHEGERLSRMMATGHDPRELWPTP